jgi:hypothetical protein
MHCSPPHALLTGNLGHQPQPAWQRTAVMTAATELSMTLSTKGLPSRHTLAVPHTQATPPHRVGRCWLRSCVSCRQLSARAVDPSFVALSGRAGNRCSGRVNGFELFCLLTNLLPRMCCSVWVAVATLGWGLLQMRKRRCLCRRVTTVLSAPVPAPT